LWRNGGYNSEDENIYYKNRIVKLNSDFTVDWQLSYRDSMVFAYLGLHQIMALNDSEFVAVGFMRNNIPTNYNQNGYLVKFNIQGEKFGNGNIQKFHTNTSLQITLP
jgi:hypothetical protein